MSTLISEVQSSFYTHKEAAAALGVTKVTLWRWLKAGRLQGHRIGREVLIEKAAVEEVRLQRASLHREAW